MTSIIWDMGGTLFDTYPQIDAAFTNLVKSKGKNIALSETAALTRVTRGHAINVLSKKFSIPKEEFESVYEDVKASWEVSPAPLMDGARELFKICQDSGGRNLIATHRDRESAQQLLSSTGLRFDDLICPGDGFPRKPDPTMMLEIMNRNGVEAASCIAVGDRPIDVEAAQAAGTTGFLLVSDPVDSKRDGVVTITHLTDLIPYLG
ncbi:MAG: HAD family hydrolase [Flaviflexus sp.]|uniref:HAD family hydrolase n=1 Tax=Flaviflexus sp. TaxID=1969482 RepID=UPI003F8ECBCF